jgi:hypothetical protein
MIQDVLDVALFVAEAIDPTGSERASAYGYEFREGDYP